MYDFIYIPRLSIGSQKSNLSPIDKECEIDPRATDYSSCQNGYYCADDACNHFGDKFDCCKPNKPKLSIGMCCEYHNDCDAGLYCEDMCDGLYCEGIENNTCENRCLPWKGTEQICDQADECQDGQLKFCSEDNCSLGSDKGAKCCGGKIY